MNKEEKEAIEILSYFETDDLSEYAMYCNALNVIKNLIQKQDKIMDKMAEQLAGLTIWNDNIQEPLILGDKEEVIEYFKKEVEKEC